MSTKRLSRSGNHLVHGQHGATSHSEAKGHHLATDYHLDQTEWERDVGIRIAPED